jgi:hypothetical protein
MKAFFLAALTLIASVTLYGQRMVINDGPVPEGQVFLTTDERYTVVFSGSGPTTITAYDNSTGDVAGSYFLDTVAYKCDVRDNITAVLVLSGGVLRVVDLTTSRVTAVLPGVRHCDIDRKTEVVCIVDLNFTLALYTYPTLELQRSFGSTRFYQAQYASTVFQTLLDGVVIVSSYLEFLFPDWKEYYYARVEPGAGLVVTQYPIISGTHAIEWSADLRTCNVIDLRTNMPVRSIVTDRHVPQYQMALSEDASTFVYMNQLDDVTGDATLTIDRGSIIGTVPARFNSAPSFPSSSSDTIHVLLNFAGSFSICSIDVDADSLTVTRVSNVEKKQLLRSTHRIHWYSRSGASLLIHTADSTVLSSFGSNFTADITPNTSFSGQALWMPNTLYGLNRVQWRRYPLNGESLRSDFQVLKSDNQWFVPRRDAMYERSGDQLTLRHVVKQTILEKYDLAGIPAKEFSRDADDDLLVHTEADGSITLLTPRRHGYWASNATSAWQRLPQGEIAEYRFVDWDTSTHMVLLQQVTNTTEPVRYRVCDTRTGALRSEILPSSDSGKSIRAILSGRSQDLVVITGRYVLLYSLDSQSIRARRIFPEDVRNATVLPDGLRLLVHWGTSNRVHSSVVAIKNLRLEVKEDVFLQPLGRDTTWIDLGTREPDDTLATRAATLLTSKNPTRTPFEPRVWRVLGYFDQGWSVILHCGERIVIHRCPVGGKPVLTPEPLLIDSSASLPDLATDHVYALVTGPPLSEISVTVSDLRGRVVSSWTFPVNDAGIADLDIPLAGYAPGFYAFLGLRPPMEPFTFTVITP